MLWLIQEQSKQKLKNKFGNVTDDHTMMDSNIFASFAFSSPSVSLKSLRKSKLSPSASPSPHILPQKRGHFRAIEEQDSEEQLDTEECEKVIHTVTTGTNVCRGGIVSTRFKVEATIGEENDQVYCARPPKQGASRHNATQRSSSPAAHPNCVVSITPKQEANLVNLVTDIEDGGCCAKQDAIIDGDPKLGRLVHSKKLRKNGMAVVVSERQKAPTNWEAIIDEIRNMRADKSAPVDLLGTHQLADETADKETQRFHLLVAAMISSQTRDSVTAAAMRRLHALPGGLSINVIRESDLSTDQLAKILKPVGFYRQKAKYLKDMAQKLGGPPHYGCVPCKMDELLKLPGVGPKVALLVLWVAFGNGEQGLIVDTNVRRVCCRLGWASEGSSPDQVRATVEGWLTKDLWPEISFLFVGFGQQVCKPINPMCGTCKVNKLCPTAFEHVKSKPETAKKKQN